MPVGQLDAETVAKATLALSSEIVLPKLIESLMRIAVEHAGAERGLLILVDDGKPQIEAEATTGHGRVDVQVRQAAISSCDLPKSMLNYVIRTNERVVLDDASVRNLYSDDEYFNQRRARSVLCLPIVKQTKLVGVLYLENNLTAHVFTSDRMAVLDMLASQAAISLENAALYTDLQLQVGLLQHLPVSAWTLEPDGTPDFVNQVWLEFSGQTLDFVRSHPEAWMTAAHPDDRETASSVFWNGVREEKGFSVETRNLRARDGTYRWHLQQAVPLRDVDGKVLKFVGTTTDIDDQKRAEEALKDSEHNLRLIIDTIPTLTWCNRADGSNEFLSRSWHEYTGLSPEEAHGWGWREAFHPEDLPVMTKRWQEMLLTGQPGELEARLRRSDGVYRWFLIRAEPFRDAAGNIVRWYGTSTDIDDRKRGEEALRESEQRFRLVLDGIAGLVAILSTTGETEAVNRRALEYFGKTTEQLKRWSTSDAVHPDDLPDVRAAWMRSVDAVSVYDVDHRLRRADGVYRWFHARGLPLCDSEGRALRWYVLFTDIHDRKQAQEKVQHSEAVLAESQRLSLTGSFTWRVGSDEVTWSRQLYRIFGFDQSVPVNLELFSKRVHPEDLPMFNEQIERSRKDGSDMEFEVRLRMPDHSIKHLHIAAHNRNDGAHPEYIGAIQDVTQRRQSEEALTRARSELADVVRKTSLGVMTASIAHEVNQPLSGVITNASTCLRMLDADPPNLDGARETVKRAMRDSNRAADMIKRLRALFAKKDITADEVDLNEATSEVIALSQAELRRRGIVLSLELADELPRVKGDRIQLQQVVMNLLLNASDALDGVEDRPKRVVIRTREGKGDHVLLSVQDNGVGFDPGFLENLFRPFCTTKVHGMGIGLSVSQSIVESHHGRIWAALNDGPGVTFSFSVPRESQGGSRTDSIGATRSL